MFWNVDKELLTELSSQELFSSFKNRELRYLTKVTEVVTLNANEVLFHRGDSSECMYLLLQGLLISILPSTRQNDSKIIGYVNPGQIVGESSFISSRQRTYTVKALHDSKLLKISKSVFDQSLKNYPDFLIHLLNAVISRAKNTIDSISNIKQSKIIAFYSATEDTPLNRLLNELQETLPKDSKIKILTKLELAQNIQYLQAKSHLDEITDTFDVIIYPGNVQQNLFQRLLVQNTEHVFIVGKGNSKPSIDHVIKEFLQEEHHRHIKKDLLLLYENAEEKPINTRRWLHEENFNQHHHIHFATRDYQYLLRYLSGKTINLVLGGGGTKGWVQVGVIKALIDHAIPIDSVGGTSAGAIIGAHYLLYQDYELLYSAMYQMCRMLESMFSPFNFTYPLVSVLNGKNRTQAFHRLFGNSQIENLWRPYFCVCANLNEQHESIKRQGSIWRWVCASSSIPGLYPPITQAGSVFLDGGVVNNLPTDIMRKYFSDSGKIIAVELTHSTHRQEKYSFPSSITFLDAFLYKLRFKQYRDYRFPTFTGTLLESLMLGSQRRTGENLQLADILIRPDLSKYKMIGSLKHAKEMINIGYEAMCEKIPLLKTESDLIK